MAFSLLPWLPSLGLCRKNLKLAKRGEEALRTEQPLLFGFLPPSRRRQAEDGTWVLLAPVNCPENTVFFSPMFSSSPAQRPGKENKWGAPRALGSSGPRDTGGPFVRGEALFTRVPMNLATRWVLPQAGHCGSVRWACMSRARTISFYGGSGVVRCPGFS